MKSSSEQYADMRRESAKEAAAMVKQAAKRDHKKLVTKSMEQITAEFSDHVPADMAEATFSELRRDYDNQKRVIDAARVFTYELINKKNIGNNLIMVGPPGVGKTHMAMAIVNHAAESGLFACYLSTPHLIRYLHSAVRSDTALTVAGVLKLLAQPDVLVLDEIGRQQQTAFNKNFMWDLIDARYRNKKPIVTATNASMHELSDLLDPAAISRLTDRGTQLLMCDWCSYRGVR